jgi:hypothetical protein
VGVRISGVPPARKQGADDEPQPFTLQGDAGAPGIHIRRLRLFEKEYRSPPLISPRAGARFEL